MKDYIIIVLIAAIVTVVYAIVFVIVQKSNKWKVVYRHKVIAFNYEGYDKQKGVIVMELKGKRYRFKFKDPTGKTLKLDNDYTLVTFPELLEEAKKLNLI